MSFISNEEINKIRSNTNIVDIIGSYLPLHKKGKDYKCVCPFHDDHSPSMSISEDKQIYKCFACNAAGNVFTFVQNYENVSFAEAVQIVASKIGYNLTGTFQIPTNNKFKDEHKLMELVNMFYQNNLNTSFGLPAKKYLESRGINDQTINDFQIGLSLDSNTSLSDLLVKKGYKEELLEKLGLVNISGGKLYDTFKGRITFPLHDYEGNIIGFSCRIYRGEDEAKYVNTKETYLYKKGDNLFNYHRASTAAKKEHVLIMVEGQLDAIRVYESGIKNVCALMGTALTKEQINLIKKLRSSVILCLDGDKAGSNATIKNGNLLTEQGIKVQVVRLSDYKDPDEYILKKGIDAFKENLKRPIDFIDFKMTSLKDDYDLENSEALATYINKVIEDISKESDPILKEVSINKISKEYNISIDILKDKLNNIKKEEKLAKEIFTPPKKEVKRLDSLDKSIRKVLFYMMNDIKYIRSYQNKLGFFENKIYRNIANEIVYYSEKNKMINVADFISYITKNQELYPIVLEIVDTDESNLSLDEFLKYVKVIDDKSKELQIKKLKEELKKELDMAKKLSIMSRITEIKKGSVLDEKD